MADLLLPVFEVQLLVCRQSSLNDDFVICRWARPSGAHILALVA
jgi:hypothetical protein